MRASDVGKVTCALAHMGGAGVQWCVHSSRSWRVFLPEPMCVCGDAAVLWLRVQGWAVWGRQACPHAHRHLLPKTEQGDAYTAYFTGKGTVFSPRVMRAARVLSCRGSQNKPWWLFGISFHRHSSCSQCPWLGSRAGRGARLATFVWAGTASFWASFCSLESLWDTWVPDLQAWWGSLAAKWAWPGNKWTEIPNYLSWSVGDIEMEP